MKQQLRQILSAFLCTILLVFSFAACGGDNTGTTGGTGTGTTAPTGDGGNGNPSGPSLPSDPNPGTPPTHEHTYFAEWSTNGTHHWHAASCEHSDERSEYAEHIYGADRVCTVCADRAFTEGLEYASVNDGTAYVVVGIGSATDTDVIIPERHQGLPVIGIDDSAFAECSSLTGITIPGSVISIEYTAFTDCSNLTSVTFCEGITSLEYLNMMFMGCSSLIDLFIPDSVTSITLALLQDENGLSQKFFGCEQLLEVENGISYIGRWAMLCDTSLQSANVREGTVGIADHAFFNCSALTALTLPDSLMYVFEYTLCESGFDDRFGEHENGVTYIGNWVIGIDTDAEDVVLREGTVGIAERSLKIFDSPKMKSIFLPKSFRKMDSQGFMYFLDLETILVDPENAVYHFAGNCLIETESKTLVAGCNTSVIPNDGSVIRIAAGAFMGRSLTVTDIIIPNGITSIEEATFAFTNLTSVTIPRSVLHIGVAAFDVYSSSLNHVYYGGTATEWNAVSVSDYDNSDLINATVYYYSATEPTDSEGNYWYYGENGLPTVW